MDGARDLVRVGINEKVHESTKLAAVFDALISAGFPAEEILRGIDVTPERVHSPKTRISLKHLTTAYQNALRLSTDQHLPYRIGTTIHISTYGMYGYALLSCPDFRKAMEFAAKYHALAAPLATIERIAKVRFGVSSQPPTLSMIAGSIALSPNCKSAFTFL